MPEFQGTPDMDQACGDLQSGKLDSLCSIVRGGEKGAAVELDINLTEFSVLCGKYEKGDIDQKEFFVGSLTGVIPKDLLDRIKGTRRFGIIDALLIIFFLIAVVDLFFIDGANFKDFFYDVGGVLFVLGIVIVGLFLVLKGVVYVIDVDTSSILSNLEKGITPQKEDVVMVVPLILNNLIRFFYLIVGVVSLAVGLVLKLLLKDKIEQESEPVAFR